MPLELIKNIKSLTRIQLKQSRNIITGGVLGIGLIMMLLNILLIFYNEDDTSYFFINVSDPMPGIFAAIGMVLIILSTNILSNNKISMFPGTSISRFISRILSDHIIMLIIIAFSFLVYCIEYPIILAISGGVLDLSTTLAFDFKYAFAGMINVLSFYLVAYGIAVLFFSFATRLGALKTIIIYTGILIVVVILLRNNIISLTSVISYFNDERNLGIFVLKTWSIWIVTMILSLLVAINIKITKEEVPASKFIIIPIVWLMIMVFAISSRSTLSSKSYSYTLGSRFELLKETNIYKETYLKCDKIVYDKLYVANGIVGFSFITETEAIKAGIIANNSLNNEVLVVTFFPNAKCKGEYLYQYYLDNMSISYENSSLSFSVPKTMTVLNFLWGDSYKFLDNYDIEDDNLIDSSSIREATVYVIAPDDLMFFK